MPRLKPEHVIEAERPFLIDQPVIAEQTAGQVADHHVGAVAGGLAGLGVEHLAVAPQQRTAAGNGPETLAISTPSLLHRIRSVVEWGCHGPEAG